MDELDRSNADRCSDAEVAVLTGHYGEIVETDCMQGAIIDLSTDLLHLAKSHGIDPERVLRQAKNNYEVEQEEG